MTAPTVIITGDSDDIVYEELHSRGLARDIAGSTLLWVRGLGHKPDWIATDLSVAAIERVAGKDVDLDALKAKSRRGSRHDRDGGAEDGDRAAGLVPDGSDAGQAVRTDIGDPEHVGGAGRAERQAGGDDQPVAGPAETFGADDAAGAVDHVVEIMRVIGDHAMQAPDDRQAASGLDDRRQRQDRHIRRSRAARRPVVPDEV